LLFKKTLENKSCQPIMSGSSAFANNAGVLKPVTLCVVSNNGTVCQKIIREHCPD
jgi:hypothetical protein